MTVDHREKEFEKSIVDHLVKHGSYIEGTTSEFDNQKALLPQTLIAFIRNTQPKAWEKLSAIHQDKVEENFIKRLCKELDNGILKVLRHGITDYGVHFDLMYSAPETSLNSEAIELYNMNILTVIRQVNHSPKSY